MENERLFSEISEIKSLLISMNQMNNDVLTFEQAKNFINCSSSYLYKLTSQNLVPCYKPRGKQLYFNRSELSEWLMSNRNTTKDEIEQQANNYLTNNKRN